MIARESTDVLLQQLHDAPESIGHEHVHGLDKNVTISCQN